MVSHWLREVLKEKMKSVVCCSPASSIMHLYSILYSVTSYLCLETGYNGYIYLLELANATNQDPYCSQLLTIYKYDTWISHNQHTHSEFLSVFSSRQRMGLELPSPKCPSFMIYSPI